MLVLTLNRPDRLNAVSRPMYEQLVDALDPERAGEVRAVVVTGAGRAFCVGADLRAHGEDPPDADTRARYVRLAQEANRRLRRFPSPVVAAVNGHAVGAGLELALSCDLVVVARNAKLRLPETALGTFVGGGVTATLPRRIGDARARELLLLCPFVMGEEAGRMGLANRVVDPDDVMATAMELAEELARRAPLSVRLAKELLDEAASLPLDEVLRREEEALLACMETADWQEGIDAFAERRPPRFRGG